MKLKIYYFEKTISHFVHEINTGLLKIRVKKMSSKHIFYKNKDISYSQKQDL